MSRDEAIIGRAAKRDKRMGRRRRTEHCANCAKFSRRAIWALLAAACFGRCPGLLLAQPTRDEVHYKVPKTWDEAELKAWTIPARDPGAHTVHVAPSFYYSIPAPPIYKSYPVYHPSKKPPGYLEWLRRQDPQVVFDASKLRTEADWIAAGKLVFEAPRRRYSRLSRSRTCAGTSSSTSRLLPKGSARLAVCGPEKGAGRGRLLRLARPVTAV